VAAILAVWQLRRGRWQAGRILLLLAAMFLAFAGALPDVGALARSQLASTLDPNPDQGRHRAHPGRRARPARRQPTDLRLHPSPRTTTPRSG
jgi:hypothetical protein